MSARCQNSFETLSIWDYLATLTSRVTTEQKMGRLADLLFPALEHERMGWPCRRVHSQELSHKRRKYEQKQKTCKMSWNWKLNATAEQRSITWGTDKGGTGPGVTSSPQIPCRSQRPLKEPSLQSEYRQERTLRHQAEQALSLAGCAGHSSEEGFARLTRGPPTMEWADARPSDRTLDFYTGLFLNTLFYKMSFNPPCIV